MGIVKNHAITGTIGKAIDYISKDKDMGDMDSLKDDEYIQRDMERSIAYASKDKSVMYRTVTSSLNCGNGGNPTREFNKLINKYGKDEIKNGNKKTKDNKPILGWHYIQSFQGKVDPLIAHEIGEKLAKEVFAEFPCVIGTHTNTDDTHNHFIICAWDQNGKKWNQDNRVYQRIREISDRLCEEYGLEVLEDTRQMKLIHYTDKDGNKRAFEPTERKHRLAERRAAGEISPDDVNSYRNTDEYSEIEYQKEDNRTTIRQDIDSLLPYVRSYDHLLQELREKYGYEIKDRKKDSSEYLKHISFKAPGQQKASRDNSLSDDGFYERENLEKVIAAYVAERNGEEKDIPPMDPTKIIPYFGDYDYEKDDPQEMDDYYRTEKHDEFSYFTVQRSYAETKTVKNTKALDKEIKGLIDTTELKNIIAEQKQGRRYITRDERTVAQIQKNLTALRTMEKEGITTRTQAGILKDRALAQYRQTNSEVYKAEDAVKKLETLAGLPKQVEIISARIERMKSNREYMQLDYPADIAKLKKYQATLAKTNMSEIQLKQKAEEARQKVESLKSLLTTQKEKLKEYNLCVDVLDYIDGVPDETPADRDRAEQQQRQEERQKQQQQEQPKSKKREHVL